MRKLSVRFPCFVDPYGQKRLTIKDFKESSDMSAHTRRESEFITQRAQANKILK